MPNRDRAAGTGGANQPPPFENLNLFATDRALREAVERDGGAMHLPRIEVFGARMGSADVAVFAAAAHHHLPELRRFDRYGQRLDEVEYHPAYHVMLREGIEAGISAAAWRRPRRTCCMRRRVAGGSRAFRLLPITMTYAAPAA
jgi:putative acyl-CoA dehydrogenase